MKILLLGPNGQVGWELQRALQPLGEVIARDRHTGADLANPESLRGLVQAVAPEVIVNAAAYTAVDKAEQETEAARAINALSPGVLGQEAARLGATLVHYSTDYVFDGSGEQARAEDAPTGPLGVYGQTKLEGELAIRASGARHLILRTSWVYAARGGNFARTMLRLAAERDSLSVIDDQIGAPTGADLIADLTAQALPRLQAQPALGGTYHLVAGGETSWHGYARLVIDLAARQGRALKVQADAIRPIPTSAYPTPARRPLNSRLSTQAFRDAFGLHIPRWETGVQRLIAEILN